MKQLTFTVGVFLLLVFFTGCAFPLYKAPVMPPQIGFITHFKAPLTTNYKNTPVGTKSGEASSTYLLREPFVTNLSISWGESTIDDAKRNGNLKEVHYVDYSYTNIFGIWGKFNIIAYGE